MMPVSALRAAVASFAICALAGLPANAAVLFSQDFSSGLSSNETITGSFLIDDGVLTTPLPTYDNNEADTYSIFVDGDVRTLEFDLSYNTESCCDILLIGTDSQLLLQVSGSSGGFDHYVYSLPGGPLDIQFFFRSDASVVSSGIRLDNVVASGPDGVPEPATWALMMVGFGGLGAMMRRRRQAVANFATVRV